MRLSYPHYPSQWLECECFYYLLEQAISLISALKELQGVTALDLNKLLRDSENFTIHYLTEKGSLLKVVSYSAS